MIFVAVKEMLVILIIGFKQNSGAKELEHKQVSSSILGGIRDTGSRS